MKPWFWLLAAVVLGMAGCKTVTTMTFSPVDLKLEPAGGGAQYLVVTNKSGQELNNYNFSVHLWSQYSRRRRWNAEPFARFDASGANWPARKTIRFRTRQSEMQSPIAEPVSRIEVVGHCDRGYFRQIWQANESGQLIPEETSNSR